jgi:peptide/nickel transport system substrate-binding protein
MNKDFDAVTLAWVSPIEGDPFQIWHSSGAGAESRSSNHVSFSNDEADEMIMAIRSSLDQGQRAEIFHSFHRLLDAEQPYMFLYTPKEFGAYHNRYRGVKWYRIRPGFDLTEWYIPKNLQKN